MPRCEIEPTIAKGHQEGRDKGGDREVKRSCFKVRHEPDQVGSHRS